MLKMKAKMIPVTAWATGIISKSFRPYLNNVQVKRERKELQKPVILGASHIIRKVQTNVKVQNIFNM